MPKKFQSLRGLRDVLPEDQPYWFFIEDTFRRVASSFGFERIIVPTLEAADLFVRGVGRETDIVSKEMYTFKDKGGDLLALRPEFTAGVVRAYIQHGFQTQPKPVKLWSFGQLFRYDRPQMGRFREFYQYNVETFGTSDPMTDAQVIWLADRFYKRLGLKGIVFQMNTLGCAKCRPKIIQALKSALRGKGNKLCPDCRRRLRTNPLRVLDCKVPSCQPLLDEIAIGVVDLVCESCRKHFAEVLEILDEFGIAYELNPRLARGLDYYTQTTFEIFEEGSPLKKNLSLGGGGRYDLLVRELGGPPTPAIGFAGGVERLVEVMKEREIKVPIPPQTEVFIVQIGDRAKNKALELMKSLEAEDILVGSALGKGSLKAQLRAASRAGSLIALILGDQEVRDKTAIVRDMKDRSQETILDRNLLKKIQTKLAGKKYL